MNEIVMTMKEGHRYEIRDDIWDGHRDMTTCKVGYVDMTLLPCMMCVYI